MLQAVEDPALGIGARLRRAAGAEAFAVHQREAGGVPELVAEVLVTLAAGQVELDVAAVGGQRSKGEAQRVGAEGRDALGVFLARGLFYLGRVGGLHQAGGALGDQGVGADAVDDVDGVEHVALRFRHLLAVAVAHQAGDVDVLERHVAGEVVGHHDHPGDPEEDDVEAGDQHRGGQARMEAALAHGLRVGPAERAVRPQGRGEPGFEHVAVAGERDVGGQAVRGAHFFLAAADVGLAGGVVPGRDAVAPPELAADAPVLDVAHPVPVGVDPVLGHEAHGAVLDQFEAALGEFFHAHEPLVGEVGLDHLAGTVAARHLQLVLLFLDQQAQGLEVGEHGLARGVAVEAAVLFRRVAVDGGFGREDVDQRQLVALADGVVVEVVRGGDLHHAGAELAVDVVVGDDGDLAVAERQAHGLADEVGVTLVVGVHHHGGVAEHGFGAGGGDDEGAAAVGERVGNGQELAVLFLAHHFQVGNGGLEHGVPVDQALAAVDQAFFEQAHEGFDDGLAGAFVHGEGFAAPVAGGAHAAHLPGDGVAGVLLPLPDLLDELVAAEGITGFALAFEREVARDDHLGGDAGVVGADLPEGVERVHEGVLERMAHVQGAGDVRGRQHDGVGLALAAGPEAAAGLPMGVPLGFEGLGFEALFHGAQWVAPDFRSGWRRFGMA